MAGTTTPPSRPRPLTAAALLAALAVVVGLVLAAREITEQQYLAHGLRRTALWTATRYTFIPALCGGLGGLLLAFVLARWSTLLSALQKAAGLASLRGRRSVSSGPALFRFILFVAVFSAAAAWLVPTQGPERLHLPYVFVALVCFAVVWLLIGLLAAAALPPLGGRDEPAVRLRLHWFALIGLAYLVIFLRAWARDGKTLDDALLAGIGLLACAVAYHALSLPARFLTRVLGALRRAAALATVARVLAFVVLGLALTLWAMGWVAGARAKAEAGRLGRNVLIIGVDTLRFDRVSLVSEDERDRDLTPNLRAKLAARGTVWTNAISQAPWTLPAVGSIFTGLYPEQHGAQYLTGQLAPDQVTLAELLREAGFHTMAVISSDNVSSRVGMHQGFAEFDQSQSLDKQAITSEQVTTRALRFLKAHRRDPFFLFVYYFDPHFNYRDHPDFDFADNYNGWLRAEAATKSQIDVLRMKRHLFAPREHAYVRDLYDEEVAYTDRQIGRVLRYLDEAGLWDSTLVIFVADHGEEFFERGWIGHAVTVYQELVHVPLVIANPIRPDHAVVDQPVETRWLFPTILDFLGLPPPAQASAPSLLAGSPPEGTLVRSSTRPVLRAGDPGTHSGRYAHLSCLVGSRWKIIHDHVTQQVQLFDLLDDPRETRDQAHRRPDLRSQLERALGAQDAALSRAAPTRRAPPVDPETLRRLKSLGYF